MATIINNPPPQSTEPKSNSYGFLIGIILLIAVLLLLFNYGLPALQNASRGTNITVPEQVDINVNAPNDGGENVAPEIAPVVTQPETEIAPEADPEAVE